MTIADWLVSAMVRLKEAGVENGRREALIMLSDLFDTDKSWIHAHPELILDELQIRELERTLGKRTDRVPLAYLRGFADFYGRRFMVNSHVLIPRPETESFIDLLSNIDLDNAKIADIGTGSGCIGITCALQIPGPRVDLYDIDDDALAVARLNTAAHDLSLYTYKSDLLQNLQDNYDVLVANLPYVPEKLITSPEIETEPVKALFSGKDGLDHYRKFWSQVKNLKLKPSYILTEALESQQSAVETLAEKSGYRLEGQDILVQLFKFTGQLPA